MWLCFVTAGICFRRKIFFFFICLSFFSFESYTTYPYGFKFCKSGELRKLRRLSKSEILEKLKIALIA